MHARIWRDRMRLRCLCLRTRIWRDLMRFQCLCLRARISRDFICFQSLCVQARICRRRGRVRRGEQQKTYAKENPHDGSARRPESDEMGQRSKTVLGQSGHPLNPPSAGENTVRLNLVNTKGALWLPLGELQFGRSTGMKQRR